MFTRAGFPKGVFQTVLIPGRQAQALIDDPRIAAVTLTGSDEAGALVAGASGAALKPTVLELGGSDPFIVLEDADLEAAARVAVDARFQNAGQSCIAAKRFIVVESVADEFEQRFLKGIHNLIVGDPTEEGDASARWRSATCRHAGRADQRLAGRGAAILTAVIASSAKATTTSPR